MPPIVDHSKCIGCGTCVRTCPVDVFELRDVGEGKRKSHVVHSEWCEYFGGCVHNCPRSAITLTKE